MSATMTVIMRIWLVLVLTSANALLRAYWTLGYGAKYLPKIVSFNLPAPDTQSSIAVCGKNSGLSVLLNQY